MSNKDLAIAASTIWVVLAAILVMFMQAGFAFLEAGLTRMKNVGHVAAKNVLVLAIASIVSSTALSSSNSSAFCRTTRKCGSRLRT